MSDDKSKITITKVIIFVVIVVGFIALSYFISKSFASTCVKGQIYDNILKKCVNECKGQIRDGNGGCRDCKDPDQFKPPGGQCQYDCSKYSKNSIACGENCINNQTQQCLAMNIPCDNIRVTYDKKCCPIGTNYTIIPSDIWLDGPPWKDTDDINTMNNFIKTALQNNVKYKIFNKEYDDLKNNLNDNNIFIVKDFINASDEIWTSLKLSTTFQDVIRPIFGKPICGQCKGELCGGVCCSSGENCVGDICCKKENIVGDKCCKVYGEIDGCCDEGDITKDGFCYTPCDNDNKDNTVMCKSKDEVCETIKIYDDYGNVKEEKSVCKSRRDCSFEPVDYIPISIKNPSDDKKPFHVCAPRIENTALYDLNGPFATCSLPNITEYSRVGTTFVAEGMKCTQDDCYARMNEQGIKTLTYDVNKDGRDICTANVSCKVSDGTKEPCNTAKCPVGDGNTQCCWNDPENTKYSGKICGDGSFCYRDENEVHKCMKGWLPNGKEYPNMDCVISSETGSFPTRDSCIKSMCGGNKKCCADGWSFRNGKCFQNDPSSVGTVNSGQLQQGVFKTFCKLPRTTGICGPAWHDTCGDTGPAVDSIIGCSSYPADGGGPPNEIVSYCICDGFENGWINYQDSGFRTTSTYGYPSTLVTCNQDTVDNCI